MTAVDHDVALRSVLAGPDRSLRGAFTGFQVTVIRFPAEMIGPRNHQTRILGAITQLWTEVYGPEIAIAGPAAAMSCPRMRDTLLCSRVMRPEIAGSRLKVPVKLIPSGEERDQSAVICRQLSVIAPRIAEISFRNPAAFPNIPLIFLRISEIFREISVLPPVARSGAYTQPS